ncbi:hypothetical protein FQT05_02690 [Enterococcus hirae]|nr:hypothetical protein [Enterococcus hirae]
MQYITGFIFLLLSVWQFVMFKQAFTNLKKSDKDTSPFIMLGLWSGLLFSILFLLVAINCFFVDFSNYI